jgi:hypothetical protein
MPEKKLVIDGMELHYEGVFDLHGLLRAIDKYAEERGYSKREKRRQEIVTPSGKEFSIELRPAKVKTEYYTLMIKIRINITNMEEVSVMKGKAKKKMHKGNVDMLFDAWAITDYRRRWQQKPYYFFLRALVDRFVWHFHFDKFQGELVDDTNFLHKNIKAYLNLHRYK